ncbi:MAG: YraN family protein [Opitutaceae bacterium]
MFDWLKRFLSRPAAAARSRGETGERLAAEFLRRTHGFVIVARNWRSPRDRRAEIDLVGRDGEVLVFVEVKTRAVGALVPGYYAVNKRKRRVLLRACQDYLSRLARKPRTFRFDVVEVALPEDSGAVGAEVRHFANVSLFPKHYKG